MCVSGVPPRLGFFYNNYFFIDFCVWNISCSSKGSIRWEEIVIQHLASLNMISKRQLQVSPTIRWATHCTDTDTDTWFIVKATDPYTRGVGEGVNVYYTTALSSTIWWTMYIVLHTFTISHCIAMSIRYICTIRRLVVETPVKSPDKLYGLSRLRVSDDPSVN